MTLIDLDEMFDSPQGLTKAPGDFTRNSRGTPYVSHPDGDTVKSGKRKGEVKWCAYGRPSSFGKDIENSFGLQRWRERMLVLGMLRSGNWPELDAAIEALRDVAGRLDCAEPLSDKAVASAVDGIIVQAKKVAKANLAAEQGTHVHELTEDDDIDVEERDPILRMERGEEHELPIEVQQAMLEAWRQGCAAYGLVMLEVERKVVHDGWRQAGTLDRLALLTQDITFANGVKLPAGTVILLDIKTGKITVTNDRVEYWHNYAVQCAVYAAARPYDAETDTRGDWEHDINQDWAIIAHLPVKEALAGRATLRLVLCDIKAGREAIATIIEPMLAWQARRDLFAFTHEDEPTIVIDVPGAPDEPTEDLYRMWLTTRLAQIAADPQAKVRMTALWPDGVPGLKSGHTHTLDELERIEAVICKVEAAHSLPFVADPRPRPQPEPTPEPVRYTPPDEGEILGLEHEYVIGLRKRIGRLEPIAKTIAEEWMAEAVEAGRGFAIKQLPSRRRWLIYRVALDMATLMDGEIDQVRATLALVIPDAEQPTTTVGAALGSLTIDEARRLLDVIPVLARTGELTFDGDVPRWSAAPAA